MRHLIVLTLIILGNCSAQKAIIVAYDGTYLGLCNGKTGIDSISDPYSRYGGQYSVNGMYSKVSRYGGKVNIYSPYNKDSDFAPYVLQYSDSLYKQVSSPTFLASPQFINDLHGVRAQRVTVNKHIPNAIHPETLRERCKKD